MRISSWTKTLYALPHNGAPLYRRKDWIDICLPFQLRIAVPSCALECLQVFIANNYPNHDCSVTANLNLLCATQTVSGLTIGEGALQCVISNCPDADLDTQSGYSVCRGVPGALPNMAATITATISSFSTLASNDATSLPLTTINNESTTSESSITSPPISTIPTDPTVSSVPVATNSYTLPSPSSPSPTSSTHPTTFITKPSFSSSTIFKSVPSLNSTLTSSSSTTTSLTSLLSTTQAPTSTSIEHTSSVSTSTATAAAAAEPPAKKQLSSSAVAGIATICVIVVGLLIGYLAYTFYVKRRAKDKRRSHRFSSFFPPIEDHDKSEPPAEPALTGGTHIASLFAPNKRFYSAGNEERKSDGFWRRSFNPSTNDIGVAIAASTRVSPERHGSARRSDARVKSLLSAGSPLIYATNRGRHRKQEDRWSAVSSLDENAEAHNQDLPALASPKTRSSSRSFSSAGIEKPPPLKLSTTKNGTSPVTTRIPLTPTYDNGNYEPTIRQVIERPIGPPIIVRTLPEQQQQMNFSMRQPSLRRMPEALSIRELPPQPRNDNFQKPSAFPTSRIPPVRKESNVTNTTTSIYTEIEEDSTPEEEDDTKQLHNTLRNHQAGTGTGTGTGTGASRPPLRDLQWPQVPRPAATKKQAEQTPSPRAVTTARTVAPPPPTQQHQPWLHRGVASDSNESIANDRSFVRFTVSSTGTDSVSAQSISAIFPTPPPRNPLRLSAGRQQPWLAQQISSACMAASQPTIGANVGVTTATPAAMPTKTYVGRQQKPQLPPAVWDGYRSPQRLRTGRPVPRRLQLRS